MRKIKELFHCKKIVYSRRYVPAEFVKLVRTKRKKYVRVAFTNKIKYKGTMPMTDIPMEEVYKIRKLPSAFRKWVFSLVGAKAKATTYLFNQNKTK